MDDLLDLSSIMVEDAIESNYVVELDAETLDPNISDATESNHVVDLDDGTIDHHTTDATESNHVVDLDDGTIDPHTTDDFVYGADDDLVGLIANSESEAFDIYNTYAFTVGFSVRKSKQRLRVDKSVSMKKYVCSHAGLKPKKADGDPLYSKMIVRCNCPALVQFDVDINGVWVVSKHVKAHNHDLCPPSGSYLLRSHRRVSKNQLAYLRELQKSGVGVADAVRVLKNQSGGSPLLGFGPRDAYNTLGNSKVVDGTDCNTLIQIFRNRQSNEKDFFFDFEVDNEGRLTSFFWRDGRMKEDYQTFGDLVVHDTTYRTNKYGMICAPFVGMNHHGNNIMFGCGFMVNEKVESFKWLFSTFLRSMNNKHPVTIMTDQCPSMSAAISVIFPTSRHRLCIWHIIQNSKKHIRALREKSEFLSLFNHVLKDADTIAEFELYWGEMTTKFQCQNDKWLVKLYELKEKWCPAYNKMWFSGGILSSQRSESTNHSISRRLSKTAGLCDFYRCFVSVISEWRSKEFSEDVRSIEGKPSMALSEAGLLIHARNVYTPLVYSMFENQYLKGNQCHQSFVPSDSGMLKYYVWVQGGQQIKHEVSFAETQKYITCTCKLFEEVGILCCHCLRIYDIHCVSANPEAFILKRWRKDVVANRIVGNQLVDISRVSSNSMAASLWTMQISRKFYRLISSSEDNASARLICEEAFEYAMSRLNADVGPIFFDDKDEVSVSSNVIQNPPSKSSQGRREKRPKSMIEKVNNKAQGNRKRAESAKVQSKKAVQNMQVQKDAYIVHPSSGSGTLHVVHEETSSLFVPLRDSTMPGR